jgi:hypothetical protein
MKSRTARRLRGWDASAAPYRSSCAGKARYATTSDAQDARRRLEEHESMVVYQCRHCYSFHIGHVFAEAV